MVHADRADAIHLGSIGLKDGEVDEGEPVMLFVVAQERRCGVLVADRGVEDGRSVLVGLSSRAGGLVLKESLASMKVHETRKAEVAQARRKRPEVLAASDLVLQALPHLYAMRPKDNSMALSLLQRASALDPGYAWAQAHAAWCYEQRLSRAWPSADESQRETAVALARHALAAGGEDSIVVGLAGFVLFAVGRDHESGLAALRRATALNPNAALVANLAGTANLFAGDLLHADEQLERVHRLNPADPAAFMFIRHGGVAKSSL